MSLDNNHENETLESIINDTEIQTQSVFATESDNTNPVIASSILKKSSNRINQRKLRKR